MQPADILEVAELSDPRVAPDGRTIAFAATTPDLEENDYRSGVWVAGIDDGHGDEIVTLEQASHLFLVVGGMDAVAVLFHQLGHLFRPLGAQQAIERDGLQDLAEVRHLDYRDVPEGEFDAVSSIGLTEHIGIRNYPAYFAFLRDKLVPGGRLLNHCITRPDNRPRSTGAFIDVSRFPWMFCSSRSTA